MKADLQGLSSGVKHVRALNPEEKIFIDLRLAAQIQFENAAAEAGLNFTLRNAASGHFYLPELMVAGVAALDYDSDGCTDIYFVNGASLPSLIKTGPEFYNRLFRNNCDGTFADVTEKAGVAGEGYAMAVATADYDNDGHADIFVAGLNRNILYRNRADGTFEDVTSKAGLRDVDPKYGKMWSISAGWFDYDSDGWLDLFVSSYVAGDPLAPCGEPERRFYCHPGVFAGSPNQLFHNNRDGTFTDVSQSSGIASSLGKGMGVAFGDMNGDGFEDVFVANDSIANFLFHNNGDGTFREVALETGVAYGFHGNAAAGMGADFRDIDDDGREDIVLSAMFHDYFLLFRNLGKPRFFSDATISSGLAAATGELTGWGLGVYDFDNDGHKDLFVACSHFPGVQRHNPMIGKEAALPNRIFRNVGNGRLEDASRTAGADFQRAAFHHGAAFADFDNDGRIDVAVSALNSPAALLRNTSPGPAHWIALKLVGRHSNRDGLGARVRLVMPNGSIRYNRATTSVGYASSSETVVRFGLGIYSTAKEIQIRWPSGRTQKLTDVKSDQVITVQER